ncbi:MAG: DUF3343 domain-containing protein [Lachnospiraceae bacterium]|nr:DUF3343 domain-containing protein [Lachnospiraceae bacterium]
MTCIATSFSHFGAIRFKQLCGSRGWKARLMPVPRTLSSSCGTCVQFECSAPEFCPSPEVPEEIEQIVEVLPDSYRELYRAEEI